jgi:alpha-tubulin suppressor-like RCC1 family protein
VADDFVYDDVIAGGATGIAGVSHTAGNSTAIIILNGDLALSDIDKDTIAAAGDDISEIYEIFNSADNPVGTTPVVAITSDNCPVWGTSFPIENVPQYAVWGGPPPDDGTILDETGLLIGTVVNPTFSFPSVDNDVFNGAEGQSPVTGINIDNNTACLQSARALTIEARVKPAKVDNGTTNEFNRIFERRRTILVTILNTDYRGDDIPQKTHKASIEVKYRVDNAYGPGQRHTCPHPQWPADPYIGNDARMHQISSDIGQYPLYNDHWYLIRVVFNSDKADLVGSNGVPVDIFIDDQGTDAHLGELNPTPGDPTLNPDYEQWAGYENASKGIKGSSSCRWGSLPGDVINVGNDSAHIGANWNNTAQNFDGQIDWVTWKPVADYSVDINYYTLDVTTAGSGTGTVNSSPAGIDCEGDCTEDYAYNTVVTLTANAATGSTFAGWSGGGCSGTGTCDVTMTAATSVTATFDINYYTLDVTTAGSGAGTVTSSPAGINCEPDCSEDYAYNTAVTLTATPDAGSAFTGWSGDADCSDGDGVVTMDSAKTCNATFQLLYTLTATKTGSGTGTVTSSPAGINCGSDCSEDYVDGTAVTLTAIPDAGSAFTGWSGDADCSDGIVTVDSSKTCIAAFIIQYQLTTSVTPLGSRSVDPDCSGGCMYNDGTVVVLTATEDIGYSFNDWTGCDSPSGSTCIMIMDADKNVTANFDFKAGADTIVAGYHHTVMLKSNGTLWAWGRNLDGQLGYQTTETCDWDNAPCSTSPQQVGEDTDWSSISAGGHHTLAIKSDGTLWAWGNNSADQLGYVSTETYWDPGPGINVPYSSTPGQVGTDDDWVAVAGGHMFTLALKSNGTLWGWGANGSYQLTGLPGPTGQIGSDTDWVAVAAGWEHTVALKSDGTLWAWGGNSYGQLGYTATETCSNGDCSSSPQQVGIEDTWIAIETGYYHTLALKSDGTLWAWGYNFFGQLGYETTEICGGWADCSSSPQQVENDNTWVLIFGGNNHTMALKSNGTFWAWGWNFRGQLGDGTTTDAHSPVQIGSDNIWISLAAGGHHSAAIKSDGTV